LRTNALPSDCTFGRLAGGTCQIMLSLPPLKSVTIAVGSDSRMKVICLRQAGEPK
jgi:hypothetical protein